MKELLVSTEGLEPPSWLPRLKKLLLRILREADVSSYRLSVVFCLDDFIQDLNFQFRQKNEPTDVLSFPEEELLTPPDSGKPFSVNLMGDIVVSLPALERNALDFSVPVGEELLRLLIHGFMHLSGWDHDTNDSGEPMLIQQEVLLDKYKKDFTF